MNSPYPEASPTIQLAHAAGQLPAPAAPEPASPDAPRGPQDRAFWVNPYRAGHSIDAERRDRGRVELRGAHSEGGAADELRCSLGRIIDLSTRGARVSRRWAMTPGGEIFTFTLRSGRDELTLRAACVWSRKSGFMQHTAGIALAAMTPEQTQLLRQFIDRHAALPVIAA